MLIVVVDSFAWETLFAMNVCNDQLWKQERPLVVASWDLFFLTMNRGVLNTASSQELPRGEGVLISKRHWWW